MSVNKQKESLLTQELLKEVLLYEHETGLFYWTKRTGNRINIGQIAGTTTDKGYIDIAISGNVYKAHRLVWLYIHGEFPQGNRPFIDHINGNPSDNRIENLKLASHAENMRNIKRMSNNTSGAIGIYRVKRENHFNTKTYTYWYWVAEWYDENGRRKNKIFNIETYGEKEAKERAINFRAEQIHLLNANFGIQYSERHGT